jgi:hypothetical protein
MAEYTRSGVSMRPNGTFPLQEALTVARNHPIFTTALAPIPRTTSRKTSPTITRPNKGKGKGKGAGSVKGVPRDLVSYWTRNKQSQARCLTLTFRRAAPRSARTVSVARACISVSVMAPMTMAFNLALRR